MLARFSHHTRALVRRFIAMWATPTPPPRPPRLSSALIAAMEAEREARERRNMQAVHRARERLRRARTDGLRAEVAARRGAMQ